ncbi:MAG: hypothetical protein EBQ95_02450 [Gammaproteobacteria bacterium]|nr:hypothetical protein [Gammaproteobacteria bacterium]
MKALDFFINFLKGKFTPTVNLQSGSYNQATLVAEPVDIDNFEAYWVVKKPILTNRLGSSNLNQPIRAIRKWNAINPQYPAYIFENKLWAAPFLGSKRPNDEQIGLAIIEIYQRTGNIIADGCNKDNFVLVDDKAICVDMDLAIHRKSIDSIEYFNEVIKHETFDTFYTEFQDVRHPREVVQTLFYIEKYLSDQQFDRHLVTPWMVKHINAFRLMDSDFNEQHFQSLKYIESFKINYEDLDYYMGPDVIQQLTSLDLLLSPLELYEKIKWTSDNLDKRFQTLQYESSSETSRESLSNSLGTSPNTSSFLDMEFYFDSDSSNDGKLSPTDELFKHPFSYKNHFFTTLNERFNESETKSSPWLERFKFH